METKTIKDYAKEFNEAFKTEREKNLEAKIAELEAVIKSLSDRITWLEYQVNIKE